MTKFQEVLMGIQKHSEGWPCKNIYRPIRYSFAEYKPIIKRTFIIKKWEKRGEK